MDTLIKIERPKPIYSEVIFDGKNIKQAQANFKKWLNKTTKWQVNFVDLGQDMQQMFVASNGEVIHCDFNASLYNGAFVDTELIEQGKPIHIFHSFVDNYEQMNKLIVEQIIIYTYDDSVL